MNGMVQNLKLFRILRPYLNEVKNQEIDEICARIYYYHRYKPIVLR
jgi:hypothetical protein